MGVEFADLVAPAGEKSTALFNHDHLIQNMQGCSNSMLDRIGFRGNQASLKKKKTTSPFRRGTHGGGFVDLAAPAGKQKCRDLV